MDTSAIGRFVAQLMEQLDERQFSDDAKVRTVALVVEIDGQQDGQLMVACTDDRPWCQIAFLDEAQRSLERAVDEALQDSDE